MKYWMDDELRMALLKEKFSYREFWKELNPQKILAADEERQRFYEKNSGCFIGSDPKCGATDLILKFVKSLNQFGIACKLEIPTGDNLKDSLDELNPFKEVKFSTNSPFHFHQYPPVAQVVNSAKYPDEVIEGSVAIEHQFSILIANVAAKDGNENIVTSLQRWERLLRIDLRRSKKDILEDIKFYLDQIDVKRKQFEGKQSIYDDWEQDKSRQREGAWRDLEIWKMRRGANKRTFSQISQEIEISVDAAKKAFAHAYFLIEGCKYNPIIVREKLKKIDVKELRRTCGTCREHPQNGGVCADLCPDVEEFVKQDNVSQSHLLSP